MLVHSPHKQNRVVVDQYFGLENVEFVFTDFQFAYEPLFLRNVVLYQKRVGEPVEELGVRNGRGQPISDFVLDAYVRDDGLQPLGQLLLPLQDKLLVQRFGQQLLSRKLADRLQECGLIFVQFVFE